MRSKLPTLLLLLSLVFVVGSGAGGTCLAAALPKTGIELQRFIEIDDPLPGEAVFLRFELANYDDVEVGYTLVDEVPADVTLLEHGGGSYNKTAGFIVWRGTLAPGERITIPYVLQVGADTHGILPLYAYMSTTRSDVLEDVDELHVGQLAWQLALRETLVHKGNATTISVRVNNPFERPLPVDFSFEMATELQLVEPLPTSITLAAHEQWTFETEVTASAVGSHEIKGVPLIGGVATAAPRHATLTLYDGEAPRAPKATVANDAAARQPITTERVHEVRLPLHVLGDDEQMLLAVRVPAGAGLVPGTAFLDDDEPVTPHIRGEYVFFPLPSADRVSVRYALTYEDRSMLFGHVPDAYNDVGLVSLGLIPRVLQGDDELLHALHGERTFQRRERVGAVILDPFDGQVFTEREQIDIEVDAPSASRMMLRVNGEEVSRDQVGGVAEDPTRYAEKYIAIPLQIGANTLELVAQTADGELLSDAITVYRSGPVARLTITPVTELVTGSVHPLLVQVTATDEDGLAPADRTPINVQVSGGKLLTPDAHPDWVGHQVLLYGGRALLQIESPAEAGVLSVAARVGDVSQEQTLVVTARADDWFLLTLGTLRVNGLLSPQGTSPSAEAGLRLVARGPVGSGVFSAAIDTLANPAADDPDYLWTGDTSSTGYLVGDGRKLHLQLERGLSYVRYGSGRVQFEGELGAYNRNHTGIQAALRESSKFALHAFVDQERADRLQEVFAGDGTAYYRLVTAPIEPHSEDLTIVVRERFYPHDVVRELGLVRSDYTIDYQTGQIWLRQPLLSRDSDGQRLSLRVRYNPVGDTVYHTVGGMQATWNLEGGYVRATARLARDRYGEARSMVALGGKTGWRAGPTVVWEAGIANDDVSSATAYTIGLSYPSLLGWNVRLSHQNIQEDFASIVDGMKPSIVTTLAGERKFTHAKLSARTTMHQDEADAPWTLESVVETDWSWRKLRPTVGLTVQHGQDTPIGAALRAGGSAAIGSGSVTAIRELPLLGAPVTRDLLEGRVNLAPGHEFLLALDRETDGNGVTKNSHAISLTHAFEGSAVNTVLRSGYESSDMREPGGAIVYSATSRWPINDVNALEFVVDHRRPLRDQALPSFGGQLGWMYKHNGGESAFRIDHRADNKSIKQSVQWRGFQPINDNLAFNVDAFISRDSTEQKRARLALSAAYRADLAAVFASIATESSGGPHGDKRSSEWRLKGAYYVTPNVLANVGYAQRITEAPTTTDKIAFGLTVRMSDAYNLLFEASLRRQHDSLTSLLGTMIGVGYRLTDELWVTFGYSIADYVGFDSAGIGFDRRRSGAFIELDFAFDETDVRRWFGLPRDQ